MSIATDLIKADHVGIRQLKGSASTKLFEHMFVITTKGEPVSVNVPYSDIVELIDIMDEIRSC